MKIVLNTKDGEVYIGKQDLIEYFTKLRGKDNELVINLSDLIIWLAALKPKVSS